MSSAMFIIWGMGKIVAVSDRRREAGERNRERNRSDTFSSATSIAHLPRDLAQGWPSCAPLENSLKNAVFRAHTCANAPVLAQAARPPANDQLWRSDQLWRIPRKTYFPSTTLITPRPPH